MYSFRRSVYQGKGSVYKMDECCLQWVSENYDKGIFISSNAFAKLHSDFI